jgi:hypothetical protein
MKEVEHIHIEHADGKKGEFHGASVHVHPAPHRREGRHGIVETPMEPEHRIFGEHEGHDMLAHIANHLSIPEVEEEKEGEGEGKGEKPEDEAVEDEQ